MTAGFLVNTVKVTFTLITYISVITYIAHPQYNRELTGYTSMYPLRSMMAGFRVNTVKVTLSNALGFFLYEWCKDLLQVDGRSLNRAQDSAQRTANVVDDQVS